MGEPPSAGVGLAKVTLIVVELVMALSEIGTSVG
jgi:hypothetical protein